MSGGKNMTGKYRMYTNVLLFVHNQWNFNEKNESL